MKDIPTLKKVNNQWRLVVDGKPFTMLAGELHNSSSSNIEYMDNSVWPYLRKLNLNSVFLAVTWEEIEPEEDKFNFETLDKIIEQARREKLKLGILWFGLWKNSLSTYTPRWVKEDVDRFPRVKSREGKILDIVSPISDEAVKADGKAFSKLLSHIKTIDEEDRTVIIVQVENEIGILGSDRDYSEISEKLYQQEIPFELSNVYGKTGIWDDAFGEDAPETFMAYQYAVAIEKIAQAGKKVYPIPMITNAWLKQYPWQPGTYPSGGPIAEYRKIWKKFAPSIDVNAPDVYVSDFHTVSENYFELQDNPLMIPEHRRDIKNMSHVFYAIGKYNALCFSPFGIEDFLTPAEKMEGLFSPQVMKMLNIDPVAWTCEKSGEFLSRAYAILNQTLPMIRDKQEIGKVHAFLRRNEHEKGTVIKLGDCELRVDYLDKNTNTPKSSGIVIEGVDREIYVIGVNIRYSLMPSKNSPKNIGISEYSEGEFNNGKYIRGRMLNGDERFTLVQTDLPTVQRVQWFSY